MVFEGMGQKVGGQQWGAAGWKPIRDPPAGALREPQFPSETCQGNKTVFGGEEAERGKDEKFGRSG